MNSTIFIDILKIEDIFKSNLSHIEMDLFKGQIVIYK